MYSINPFFINRMWHKVTLFVEYSWFEIEQFIVSLLIIYEKKN